MSYKNLNIIGGWLAFLIASTVYMMTIEPTVSLWDCGEFISASYKLEVGHPPGAPFFLMVGRVFSLFASGPEEVAYWINILSGLAAGFTIMFLFWTITYLAKKMLVLKDGLMTAGQITGVLGAGFVGAMACTFSDTFWFSAVEAEVYSMSSLFTAAVFWAILRWEAQSDDPSSFRWIMLIAFLMGLSIGVHLLNLLAIPAIVFIFFFKKYEMDWKKVVGALAISAGMLLFMMYGVIPGVVKLMAYNELLFINDLGLGFDSGTYYYVLVMLAFLSLGSLATYYQEGKKSDFYLVLAMIAFNFVATNLLIGAILTVVFLGFRYFTRNLFKTIVIVYVAFLIGYVIFYFANDMVVGIVMFLVGLIVSYSLYNIKYSNRDNKILMKSFKASYKYVFLVLFMIIMGYSSYTLIIIRSSANTPMNQNAPNNAFALLDYLNREQYGDSPLFYGAYYNAPIVRCADSDTYYKKTKPIYTRDGDQYKIIDYRKDYCFPKEFYTVFPRMHSLSKEHESGYKKWGKVKGKPTKVDVNGSIQTMMVPTFGENLRFFFDYQVGFMYGRYFMWNFAGRQNNIQGYGDPCHGNWISGIKSIDEKRLGQQDNQPDYMTKNKARNTYYFLPLLLGLGGLLFQYLRKKQDFWVVMLLFFFTGIAIVMYLNQKPMEPRERDYAYAGSFYAFTIWIGLGVFAIYDLLSRKIKGIIPALASTIVCFFCVPYIMADQNWDDHDRSGRYMARDYAANYLNSCPKNAVLFTVGDNDTFPLWYAQEVEGIGTDKRVLCMPYLAADWYIDQMKIAAYESEVINLNLDRKHYISGQRDMIAVINHQQAPDTMSLGEAFDFLKKDRPEDEYFFPAKSFKLKVNKQNALNSGIVMPDDADKIQDEIVFTIPSDRLTKDQLIVLNVILNSDWKRPVCFSSPMPASELGLEDYLQFNGFAYVLIPFKSNSPNGYGHINTTLLYDYVMNKFEWGNLADDVYLDYYQMRTARVVGIRNIFSRLAIELAIQNKKDKALKVADKCLEVFPIDVYYRDAGLLNIINAYYYAGNQAKADSIFNVLLGYLEKDLRYYHTFDMEEVIELSPDIKDAMVMIYNMGSYALRTKNNDAVKKIEELLQLPKFKTHFEYIKKIYG
ncbi:MAG: hypothetical protein A2W91_00660 [Bacteroidetes bacterium GWF2_38_335]|nr:MAG: hypothetical protein A2W91_00660 [Bacteroidetes bacterium GWF2_38_335]OFY78343.1 MAG: hypothetical protein A2281_04040 [Bacteroidetes bacterium RIFOXYA12_FULL_38_20]HBS87460.1 hypothetical protein [Bacteroidales bacterium]